MPLPFILAGAIAVGAKKGANGYQKMSEATEIFKDTKEKYNSYKFAFDSTKEEAEKILGKLDDLQLQIGQDFTEFRTIADSLLKKLNKSKENKNLKMYLPEHFFNKIAYVDIAIGVMMVGRALASPLTAIISIAFGKEDKAALENAKEYRNEVNKIISKLDIGTKQLIKVISTVNTIHSSILSIYEVFQSYFEDLKAMDDFIRNKGNIEQVGDTVLMIINNGYQISAILTDIITTPLFKLKKVNGEVVVNEDKSVEFEIDSEGMQVLNTEEINDVLLAAKHSIKPFENKN